MLEHYETVQKEEQRQIDLESHQEDEHDDDRQVLFFEEAGQSANCEVSVLISAHVLHQEVHHRDHKTESSYLIAVDDVEVDQRVEEQVEGQVNDEGLLEQFHQDVHCRQFELLSIGRGVPRQPCWS